MLIDIKKLVDLGIKMPVQVFPNSELVLKCSIQHQELSNYIFDPEVIDITDFPEYQSNNNNDSTSMFANNDQIENEIPISNNHSPENPMRLRLRASAKLKRNHPIKSIFKAKDTNAHDFSRELRKSTQNINKLTPLVHIEEKCRISPLQSPLCVNPIKHSFTGKSSNTLINIPSSPIAKDKTKKFYLNSGCENEIMLKTMPYQPNRSYEILDNQYDELNNSPEVNAYDEILRLNSQDTVQIDTMCNCVFISGLSNTAELMSNSGGYPSMCEHKECSIFSSFNPSIISKYQNDKKYQIDISDLTSQLCFPVGIKLCYMTDEVHCPSPYKPFMNVIKNEKGVTFYVMSLFYYKKMSISEYEKEYLQNPLKEYAKFQDIVENDSNFNENEFNEKLQIISKFISKDEIYIPECISLISKYPYLNQMEICLKNMLWLPLVEKEKLINHIVNEIVIPEKGNKIMFYIPNEPQIIELNSPFTQNRVPLSPAKSHLLFEYLSTENIVTILHLMLLEQKILFIHDDYQELSDVSFAFISLLYPFSWVNTYVPVVSLSTVKFLQSIIPFVMGTDEFLLKYFHTSQCIEEDLPSIIYVKIAKDTLSLTVDMKKKTRNSILKELKLPEFPSKVNDYLLTHLRNVKKSYKNKKIQKDKVNEKIKEIVCHGMVMLIGDYKKHMFMTKDDMPLFNSEGFLSMKDKKEKNYYQESLVTQMFSQFLLNEKIVLSRKQKRRTSSCSSFDNNNTLNRSSSIEKDGELVDTTYFSKMLFKYNDQFLSRNPRRSFSFKKNSTQSKRTNSSETKLNISNSNISSNINLETTISRKDSNRTLTRKDSLTSLDIMKNSNCNYLIPPYFIKDPSINTDKYKIEEFIQATTKTHDQPGISHILNKYSPSDFVFENIKDSNKRYSIQPSIQKIGNQTQINRVQFHLKNASVDVNPIGLNLKLRNGVMKELEDEQNRMSEWFTNICTPEKNKAQKIDITNQIKSKQGREDFANLIMQSSVLDDRSNKMISSASFDEMLRSIKIALAYVTNSEYHICKLITLALFSYYKTDKKNTFLYEEYANKPYQCKLWSTEEFWEKWYKEDLNEKENENDEDNSRSSNESINNEKYLLLRMEELMKQLGLSSKLIKKVILKESNANQYLDNDEFNDFDQNYVMNIK